jgi:hypothetical protein
VQNIFNTESRVRQPAPSELTPVKEGHGAEHTICWTCGKLYRGDRRQDCRVHKDHHRRALTARVALASVGPLPLPITRTEWQQLEQQARHDGGDPVENALRQMWLEYARSLSPDYDVKLHIDWRTWVLIELGRDVGTDTFNAVQFSRFNRDVREALTARFGKPITYYRSIGDLRRCGKRRRARR